jgi:cell division protein FtsZ
MVFITAGMGGGTGTGAAPIVAEVAKEMGILTVAVVTKPFDFENRMRGGRAGHRGTVAHVDSLIVVLNEKLTEVLGETPARRRLQGGRQRAEQRGGGIAEIINVPGLVNVDFQDVRTVMGEMGKAMMGSAEAAGMDRARIAAEQAVASPLLEGVELSGARGVLVNITASSALKMKEVREAMNTIRAFAAEGRPRHLRHGVRRRHGRPPARHRGGHRPGRGARPAVQAAHDQMVAQKTGTDNMVIVEHRHRLRRAGGAGGDAPAAAAPRSKRWRQRGGQARHPGLPAQAGGLMAGGSVRSVRGAVRRAVRYGKLRLF